MLLSLPLLKAIGIRFDVGMMRTRSPVCRSDGLVQVPCSMAFSLAQAATSATVLLTRESQPTLRIIVAGLWIQVEEPNTAAKSVKKRAGGEGPEGKATTKSRYDVTVQIDQTKADSLDELAEVIQNISQTEWVSEEDLLTDTLGSSKVMLEEGMPQKPENQAPGAASSGAASAGQSNNQ